jgi:DNA modification methylase
LTLSEQEQQQPNQQERLQREKNTIPIKNIIIKERYRKELGDIDTLADNINNLGLLQPIVINNENNELIDGQRRILAFESLGKKEIPCFKVDLQKIVLGEFSANHYRKDWTFSEMVAIKRAIEPYERKKARERKWTGKTCEESSQGRSGRSREKVAGFVGISHDTLKKAEEIVNAVEEESELYKPLLDKMNSKKISVNKAYKILKNEKARKKLLSKPEEANPKLEIPENCKLILGDFIEQSQKEIADSSIDLIFTDPPYGKEYLPLYQELANLAVRVLKPGGSLVFFVGHIILDDVFTIFREFSLKNNNSNLKYWWTLAVKHSGHHTKIHPRYVFAEWKPMVWYIKGDRINDFAVSNTIGDYIESVAPLKIEHEWQQSTVEAEYIIKNLTIENQTVLDPMMGSGTTGLATLNLRRNFIGIEKNPETFEIASIRINKQEELRKRR